MYFARAQPLSGLLRLAPCFQGAAVILLALSVLSEASIGGARAVTEEPGSCMTDASTQHKALMQVRGVLGDTGSADSGIRDGALHEENQNAEFDCTSGLHSWKIGWSKAKKEWCCTHEGVGCDFNCKEEKLQAGWSDSKKAWCCKNKNVGCQFNCTKGEVANWKEDKATWCCQNELVGCGFNCSAGFSKWEQGWSTLKQEYCCKNELLGCTFNCSMDRPNAWAPMEKAWCCKTQRIGCEDERHLKPCQTQEDVLAVGSLFRGPVAPPGTPCVFGLDERDEGYHCILDGGSYGSWGWCYTSEDKSTWGACNEDCPLFGPAKKIGDRLKNMTDLLAPQKKIGEQIERLAKQLEGPLLSGSAKGGATGDNSSQAPGDASNVTEEAKKGDDQKGSKKDEKKDAKKDVKNDAKADAKKDAKKGGKKD